MAYNSSGFQEASSCPQPTWTGTAIHRWRRQPILPPRTQGQQDPPLSPSSLPPAVVPNRFSPRRYAGSVYNQYRPEGQSAQKERRECHGFFIHTHTHTLTVIRKSFLPSSAFIIHSSRVFNWIASLIVFFVRKYPREPLILNSVHDSGSNLSRPVGPLRDFLHCSSYGRRSRHAQCAPNF